MGLKHSLAAAGLFRDKSFMQTATRQHLRGKGDPSDNHPGRDSLAKPGVGKEQEVADNGRSQIGTVTGSEPYVTVLKDGFFEVGCYHDAMLEFGDKYGNNADKYNMADTVDVSIALYSELVLKDEQSPMTPTICFEFCRTIPGSVFFGLSAGRDCYCTPFYKPQPGDNQQCDQGCEGDSTKMCGNMKGKSSVFEMHLCATTAADLTESSDAAKEALDFYFENALLASDLGKRMSESAERLEENAGVAGSTTAADMARVANGASKQYTQAYQKGADAYNKLLGAFKDAKALDGKDFTSAVDTTAAEHAMAVMKPTTTEVLGLATEMHFINQLSYPLADQVVFGDAPDSGDSLGTMLAREKAKPTENINFRDAPFAMGETNFEPEGSSCSGPTIGAPLMGMGLAGCAAACEATVSPQNCKGFSVYDLDGKTDLCLLLEDVDAIETFACEGDAQKKGSPAGAKCMIKMSEIATGYKPKAEMKKFPRCFSSGKGKGVAETMTELSMPGGSEVKVGSGAALAKAP